MSKEFPPKSKHDSFKAAGYPRNAVGPVDAHPDTPPANQSPAV
jgi:hypothetical protein